MTSPFIKNSRTYIGPGWFNKPGVKVIGIPSGEAFGNHLVANWQIVTVPSIPSAEAFGALMLAYNQFILPASINTAQAFGTHTVLRGAVNLAPTGIASAQAFGTATVGRGPVSVAPQGIPSGEAFGDATVDNPPNMMLNPTFENALPTYYANTNNQITTDQARSGTKSFKITSPGDSGGRLYFMYDFDNSWMWADVEPNDLFYVEFYARKHPANTGVAAALDVRVRSTDGVTNIYPNVLDIYNSEIPDSDWVKISALYRHELAPEFNRFYFYLQTKSTSTAGDIWYIDDVQIIRTQELSPMEATENFATDPDCSHPELWVDNGGASISVTSETAYRGTTSLKVVKDTEASYGLVNVLRRYDGFGLYDLEPVVGQTITLRGRLRKLPGGPTVTGRTMVRFRDDSNAIVGGSSYVSTVLTDEWQDTVSTIAVPVGATKIDAGFYINNTEPVGSGYYLDDIRYEKEGIGSPSVGYEVETFSAHPYSTDYMEADLSDPRLWAPGSASSSTFEITDELGDLAIKLTRTTMASTPGIWFTRTVNGSGSGQNIPVEPGELIFAKVKYRASPENIGTNQVFVQANLTDSNEINSPSYPNSGQFIVPTDDWLEIELKFEVPSGKDRMLLGARFNTLNTQVGDIFYVKDFELVRSSKPSISVGPVNVSPSGIASAEAFGNAIVGRGPVNVAPVGIPSAEAVGTFTVVPAQLVLAPSIASAEAFGTQTILRGPVNISTAGISSAEAFGSATITTGNVNVAPSGVVSGEAFGTSVIGRGPVNVAPSGIASGEAFGSHTVTDHSVMLLGHHDLGYDSSSSVINDTMDSRSITIPAGTDLLLLCISGYKSSSASVTLSIDVNGTSLSPYGSMIFANNNSGANQSWQQWFYLEDPPIGTYNLNASRTASGFVTLDTNFYSRYYAGVGSIANHTTSYGGSGTSVSISFNSTNAGAMVVCAMGADRFSTTDYLDDFDGNDKDWSDFYAGASSSTVGDRRGGTTTTFTASKQSGYDHLATTVELVPA